MNAKDLNKEEILKKVQSLPNSYWEKRFKKIESNRQDKLEEVLAEALYLFSIILDDIVKEVNYFLSTLDFDSIYLPLTRSELREFKNYISIVQADMDKEGLEFDKDVAQQFKRVTSRTSKIEALKLKVVAKSSYLYSVLEKRFNNLFDEVVSDFYYMTLYEIIKAVGYDSDKVDEYDFAMLTEVLRQSWRATDESFDDVIWRLGRTLNINARSLIEYLIKTNSPEAFERIQKLINSSYNSLERDMTTDLTFVSTLAQSEAFTTTEVEEAVFTAILDERTSDMCREADGNVIPVEEIIPWENAPPLHYYCRSTLVPIIKEINWLTGEVYEVDKTFDSWYERHWGKDF